MHAELRGAVLGRESFDIETAGEHEDIVMVKGNDRMLDGKLDQQRF